MRGERDDKRKGYGEKDKGRNGISMKMENKKRKQMGKKSFNNSNNKVGKTRKFRRKEYGEGFNLS